MRFERLRLTNFRCYESATVEFDEGVTVVQGGNGAGKTSLLKACFVALYGSDALGSNENLADVVTNGTEESHISLGFTHAGDTYTVEQEIAMTGSGDDRRATTRKSVLTRNGEAVGDDGVTSTREEIESLLRMDADAFVNCAYVRQGEVNKLIEASPDERRRVVDELLQLGKLETYRERADEARLGVKRVRQRVEDRLEDRREAVKEIEDTDPHERLSSLRENVTEKEDEIENYERQVEKARDSLRDAEERLESHDETKERLDEVEEQVAQLEGEIDDRTDRLRELRDEADEKRDEAEGTEADLKEARDEEEEAEERVSSLQDTKTRLETRVGSKSEALEDAREAVRKANERAEKARNDAEKARDELAEKRDALEEARAELEDVEAPSKGTDELRGTLADRRDRRASVETRLKTLRDGIEGAEEKLADGVCPTCGQEIHGEPDFLREDREKADELEGELKKLEEKVDEAVEAVEEAERAEELYERTERLEDGVDTAMERVESREEVHEEAMEEVEEAAGRLEELKDELGEAEEEKEAVAEQLEDARERLQEARERREEAERAEELAEEAERLEDRAGSVEEVLEEKRERLREKRELRDELNERIGDVDVEELRDRRDEARDYIERATDRLDSLRDERDEIQNAIGGVENRLERLDGLRDEIGSLEQRLDDVDEMHDDAVALKDTYASLRHELRSQNLRRLDQLLNEVFETIYANASYSRVELDEDYEITVHEKDGTTLDPERLSGGERAVFNLSLRCAVYRLLVEGTGAKAALPPLILDEPTTFLDDKHVSRLIRLVRAMNDEYGVEQVVVVSHDAELLDAADSRIVVEKEPTTNRSRVVEAPLSNR
ncbi:MAG: exonuclease SbcC [Methanobacteriota archaeon]